MPAEYPTVPFAPSPESVVLETVPYWAAGWAQSQAALVSGKVRVIPIQAVGGAKVSTITFTSGTTASSSLTHSWCAIYSVNIGTQTVLSVRSISNDDTTAWAANTPRVFTLRPTAAASAAPYVFRSEEMEYVAIMVAATTVPTLAGLKFSVTLTDPSNGIYSSGFTTPSTAPGITFANVVPDKIVPALVMA